MRAAVSEVPGYAASEMDTYGLAPDSLDHGAIKDTANRLKYQVLTKDQDFLDQVKFAICTHPGVLVVNLRTQRPTVVCSRIVVFLKSQYFKVCKHGIVELRDEEVRIHQPGGGYRRIEL
jgi:hypothetical protein